LPDLAPRLPDEEKVYEAEVVGLPPAPPPLWKRIFSRLFITILLVLLGLGLCGVGLVMTLTIVGAVVGSPLMFAGAGLILTAFFLPLGAGSVRFQTFRSGRGNRE
jgi:hypothetical protein